MPSSTPPDEPAAKASTPDETPVETAPESPAPVHEPSGPDLGWYGDAGPGFHPPPPHGLPPGFGYPGGYPFAPQYREPWINPSKKRAAGLAALVAALVLLGGGFALGAATGGGGHGERTGYGRVGNDHGNRDGMRNGFPNGFPNGPGRQLHPGRNGFPPPTAVPAPASSAPTSVPAATSTAPAPKSSSR